ncbi:MAG: hypothetical protein AAF529_14585 [Pseudomonadota bacterium]
MSARVEFIELPLGGTVSQSGQYCVNQCSVMPKNPKNDEFVFGCLAIETSIETAWISLTIIVASQHDVVESGVFVGAFDTDFGPRAVYLDW